jgi:superfamily I DNA/RNA helicase
MSNLQIKGIDEELYGRIKEMANAENRSLSQQILFLAKEYLAKRKKIRSAKSPAQVLLELSGSWDDEREAEKIVKEIKQNRRNSRKLKEGW